MSSLREFLTGIANAIRNKKGTTAPINAQNFASEIDSIETGGGEDRLKKLLDYTKSCYYMFYQNTTITDADSLIDYISYDDTSNVTNMGYMFYGCSNLTTTPLLNTSNVANVSYMFTGCYKLITIDISKYNISSTSYSNSFAYSCYSLKRIIIRSFGSTTLNSNAFKNCYHLNGTVNDTYNPNGDKDCYIYVPRAYVDTLKSATNWSTYADQIRALEDYTVDGTTTGDLDETKI